MQLTTLFRKSLRCVYDFVALSLFNVDDCCCVMHNDGMNHFAQNIKTALKSERLSVQELSDRCGLDRSYLSRLIHDHHSPSLQMVEKIATALNVQPFEMLVPDFFKNCQNTA